MAIKAGSQTKATYDNKKHVRVGDDIAPSFVGAQKRIEARGDSKKQIQINKQRQSRPTLTLA